MTVKEEETGREVNEIVNLCDKCRTNHIVKMNEESVRLASPSDECVYCERNVGDEHAEDCVTLMREVRVRLSIEIIRSVPETWTAAEIDDEMNRGSYSGNLMTELEAHVAALTRDGGCLCGKLIGEYVGEVKPGIVSHSYGNSSDYDAGYDSSQTE